MVTALLILFVASVMALFVTALFLLVLSITPRPWHLWLAGTIHAVLLTTVLVVWLNPWPGFFPENEKVMGYAEEARDLFQGTARPTERGVDLILIDNSLNKVFIPDSMGTEGDGRVHAITDRERLTALCDLLADNSANIRLVAIDILFDTPTPADSALGRALDRLGAQGKLVLARGPNMNVGPLRQEGDNSGGVTTILQKGKVVWHELAPGGRPSLPYRMYLRTTGTALEPGPLGLLDQVGGPHPGKAYPAFMPALHHFSESWLDPIPGMAGTTVQDAAAESPMALGSALLPFNRMKLERRLEASPGAVVFIGEFSTPTAARGEADVHATMHGPMHGSVILLNTYLDLLHGAHHLNWWSIGTQLALFTLASLFIFSRPWRAPTFSGLVPLFRCKALEPVPPEKADGPKTTSAKENNWLGRLQRPFRKVLVDSFAGRWKKLWPTFLLIALCWLLQTVFHTQINLAAVAIYMGVLDQCFRHLDLSNQQPHANP